MLAPRVILLLTLKDGQLCRTKNFRPDRWYTLNFVDLDIADEAVLLNVGGTEEAFEKSVLDFMDECFIPAAVGGGVRTAEAGRGVLKRIPCEKVVIGRPGERLKAISDLARSIGCQSVVAGVTEGIDADPVEAAIAAEGSGAGEILVQSVRRDGSLEGYDEILLEKVVKAVRVPVVVGSGCGTWGHMKRAFDIGASGAATSVIHHLTGTSLKACKTWLNQNEVRVRI